MGTASPASRCLAATPTAPQRDPEPFLQRPAIFVFNDPDSDEWDGAFHGAGHVVGGPHLTLSGHISRSTEPFVGDPLTNPAGAKVHFAIAPHGALDPNRLPAQIHVPSGSPEHWWLAHFD